MNHYLYFRGLRLADYTVFCVEAGQKKYWNDQFANWSPFSSGQQVKRCIIEDVITTLGDSFSPTIFNSKVEGGTIKPKQAFSICDPSYADQLLGGWMLAKSKEDKGKARRTKQDENNAMEETENREETGKSKTIKRRSPLSISAMRPLHPLLARTTQENITFDRSGQGATYNSDDNTGIHKIIVRNTSGNIMTAEEVEAFIDEHDLPPVSARIWIPADKKKGTNTRASGMFIHDVAIDLRRLMTVSLDQNDPELELDTIEKLRSNGWIESKNVFGKCLVCPKSRRDEIIAALAYALVNWRITSNQSRTFSLMETLAIAISGNANKLASAIRAKLSEDTAQLRAVPIIDDTVGADLFITLPCEGYIPGVSGTANALVQAEQKIKQELLAFDYEKQL